MAFERILLRHLAEILGDLVEINYKVGTLEMSFDILIHGDMPKIDQVEIPKVFKTPHKHICEFKSTRDVYRSNDIVKVIGYAAFYSYNQKYTLIDFNSKVMMWLVVAKTTKELKNLIKEGWLIPENFNGIYKLKILNNYRIMLIEELDIEQDNLPFLISGPKKTIKKLLNYYSNKKIKFDENIIKYLTYRYLIDHGEFKDMPNLEQVFKVDVKKSIREAIKDLGIKFVIEAVGLKEVIEAVGLKEVIDAVGTKKLLEIIGENEIRTWLEQKNNSK